MKVLYRLPGMGWSQNRFTDTDGLWGWDYFQGKTLVVGTTDEFDYLQAMGLMKGEHIKVVYDPSYNLLRTNVVEIRIELEPRS